MHARQTSKKVKAALHTKFVNGAHYGAYPPIGYIKAPDQKGRLIPDTDYMWIVEKIFDLAAHGNGGAKIRRLLEEAKVPRHHGSTFKDTELLNTYSRINPKVSGINGRLHRSRKFCPTRYISETVFTTVRHISLSKTRKRFVGRKRNGSRLIIPMNRSFQRNFRIRFMHTSTAAKDRRRTAKYRCSQELLKCSGCG